MEMMIPIENQEIPQTGLNDSMNRYSESCFSNEVTGLELEYNAKAKEMQGAWDEADQDDCCFNFQFYTSNINPDGSMLKEGITRKVHASVRGMARGQRTFFRVRLIRNTVLGPWSNPLEKRVP